MKFLIVGLGNPGEQYAQTRHNVGFKVLDLLAKELGISFTLDKAAFKAEAKYKGRQLVLIKPITYMNLSGKAVNYWLQTEKIPIQNLLVITDDIALPFGTIRLKGKGMPYMRGSGNGDLYVQVNTEVPISLNKEQKELLEKFRDIENEKSNPSIKKFFQKAKSFWNN